MTKRNWNNYMALFNFVKESYPNLKPNLIMTDYEMALMNAIENTFSIEPHGCYFHFTQVLNFFGSVAK